MGRIQDYHLHSLLKILTHLHDRLHERYLVPYSMLMLEEISKQRFFFASIFHVLQRAMRGSFRSLSQNRIHLSVLCPSSTG